MVTTATAESWGNEARGLEAALDRAAVRLHAQRVKGYTREHDIEHLTHEPYACIGLVAQYAAAGRWDDVAALGLAFSIAAEADEEVQ